MHLLFILQISLFQETVLFKRCCTFVTMKAFLFQLSKYMLFWRKASAIVLDILYWVQGEMHFHCSLRN